MDACTTEVGLLRKKPCGANAVAHCLNCEQALCVQHALPQLSEAGKKTGKFLCKECEVAWREQEKAVAKVAKAHPAAAAPKPAAPTPPPAAPAKPAPQVKGGDNEDSGSIDFTPTKK